jgi:hypothetical protein
MKRKNTAYVFDDSDSGENVEKKKKKTHNDNEERKKDSLSDTSSEDEFEIEPIQKNVNEKKESKGRQLSLNTKNYLNKKKEVKKI